MQNLAEQQNHAEAYVRLAEIYYNSAFVQRDHHKALEYTEKAANLGSPGGMYLCGEILRNKHLDDAIAWYKQAAQQQHPESIYRLGEIYQTSEKWDHKQSAAYFLRVSQTFSAACVYLKAFAEHFDDLPDAVNHFQSQEVPKGFEDFYQQVCSHFKTKGGLKTNKYDHDFMKQIIGFVKDLNEQTQKLGNRYETNRHTLEVFRDVFNTQLECSRKIFPTPNSPKELLARVKHKRPDLDYTQIEMLPIFQ